MITGHLSNLP